MNDTDNILAAIAQLGAGLNAKMDGLGAELRGRIDVLETRVTVLGARLEAKIDALDERLDALQLETATGMEKLRAEQVTTTTTAVLRLEKLVRKLVAAG